jgi:hypothetical protein
MPWTWSWFVFFLVLHVVASIVAFGPTFAFPIIGKLSQTNPEHGAFGVKVILAITRRMVEPVAVVVPLLGVGLIYTGHIDLWRSEWLVISIVLYAIAFFFANLVQNRNVAKFLTMLQAMPPGPPPEGAAPPAELTSMVRRINLGGAFLAVAVVVITLLMIWRPGAALNGF